MVPELTKYVADRMHQESQILKEKRKQGELKGGKGKDKPNPPKAQPKGGGAAPVRLCGCCRFLLGAAVFSDFPAVCM